MTNDLCHVNTLKSKCAESHINFLPTSHNRYNFFEVMIAYGSLTRISNNFETSFGISKTLQLNHMRYVVESCLITSSQEKYTLHELHSEVKKEVREDTWKIKYPAILRSVNEVLIIIIIFQQPNDQLYAQFLAKKARHIRWESCNFKNFALIQWVIPVSVISIQ